MEKQSILLSCIIRYKPSDNRIKYFKCPVLNSMWSFIYIFCNHHEIMYNVKGSFELQSCHILLNNNCIRWISHAWLNALITKSMLLKMNSTKKKQTSNSICINYIFFIWEQHVVQREKSMNKTDLFCVVVVVFCTEFCNANLFWKKKHLRKSIFANQFGTNLDDLFDLKMHVPSCSWNGSVHLCTQGKSYILSWMEFRHFIIKDPWQGHHQHHIFVITGEGMPKILTLGDIKIPLMIKNPFLKQTNEIDLCDDQEINRWGCKRKD